MVSTVDIFTSVLVLFLLIIPGFLLRKAKLANDDLPVGLSNIILYIAQPALIIVSYIRPYDSGIMKTALGVLVFSFVMHAVFFGISLLFFKNAFKRANKSHAYLSEAVEKHYADLRVCGNDHIG